MSRIQLALLTGGALVIASAALIMWRTRRGPSPLESLQQLEHAVRTKDRPEIEQFLDVRRAAESVVDEALSTAAALDPGATSERRGLEGMRSSMVALVELNVWTTLLDPAAREREDAALDLRTLIDRYQGIAGVQQQRGVARVGVRLGQGDGDSAVVVHLRMEPAAGGGHWRIVGVEDLGPYFRASLERRLERAHEAEMTSALRNLVTAQAMYFADHMTYTQSLGALTDYATSGGVSVEMIEVNRDGWRAVARHHQASAECRIAVGTLVPPGDVERQPTCSRPGQP